MAEQQAVFSIVSLDALARSPAQTFLIVCNLKLSSGIPTKINT
jgi:hypothetical protein